MPLAGPATALKRLAILAGSLALIAVVWLYLDNVPALASGAVESASAIVSVDGPDRAEDHGDTCPPSQQGGEKACHSMAGCPVSATTSDDVARLDYALHYVVPRGDQIHPSHVVEPQPQPPQNS